jgi:anti-anti-sigma regulatory factor
MAVNTSGKTFGKASGGSGDSIQEFGRVLMIRCAAPLDGERGSSAVPAEEIASRARRSGARVVLLDLSHTPYADSGGLRWLLKLQRTSDQEGFVLRVVAAPGGRVRRNLVLLRANLDLYDDAHEAWYGRHNFDRNGGAMGAGPASPGGHPFGQHPPQPVRV